MASEHIVVDGSNIATEGRSEPSLSQLEEAVAELRREYQHAEVTVIVDATFAHRIKGSELGSFEAGVLKGDYVQPPAGAIGRGDAFLLRVAERVDAVVLSNDSFQEFHGEHPWLFDRGRLLGATPVPGIGWIFSPRTPVRGPASRRAVRDSAQAKRQVSKAIALATKEAVASPSPAGGGTGAAGGGGTGAATVNDPLTFISFIAEHPLGTEVEGEVQSYTSHGAVVMVGHTQCYIPLANMAVPAPRAAREVLKRRERRTFVITALDPQRRGVELSLPGVGAVSGRPRDETIEAELKLVKKRAAPAGRAKAASAASPSPTAPKLPAGKAPIARGRPVPTAKGSPATTVAASQAPVAKGSPATTVVAPEAKAASVPRAAVPADKSVPVKKRVKTRAQPAASKGGAPRKKAPAVPSKKAPAPPAPAPEAVVPRGRRNPARTGGR